MIVVEPEAVGTGAGAAPVKGSVDNAVSEDSATRDTSVPRWTFAVLEKIQSGHVDKLAPLRTGGSSFSSAPLVPCIFTAKRVMMES